MRQVATQCTYLQGAQAEPVLTRSWFDGFAFGVSYPVQAPFEDITGTVSSRSADGLAASTEQIGLSFLMLDGFFKLFWKETRGHHTIQMVL